ncbi:solute carrier family 26 member 6 [Colossoma macropomum]|uniref:solute carrier family 26 member 6 n=1 Tax=Colossoma macropomum TaxID=42526 RepID=UPI001864C074|nr:solute carrier family 26 member 6 [Colossoma macropomum]
MSIHETSELQFCVKRDILDELGLDEVASRQSDSRGPSLKEKLQDSLRCSVSRLKKCILAWLPVLSWLPYYPVRQNALGDLFSGVSVGILHLPQGMAYALLATVPPVFGLYTSFYPVLVYFIFGTSRHISVGSFAVIGIMTGGVTEKLAPDDLFLTNGVNGSAADTDARDQYRIRVVAAVTLLCGLFQVVLGLVRFGFVVTYLSEPLVRAYTTAAAMHVVISQLKYTFGLAPKRFCGPLAQIYTLIDLCALLPGTHIPTLVVSVVALAVLIVVKEVNSIYRQKLPLPIPIELLVIIVGTLVSHYAQLNPVHAVEVVGEIPCGLVPPRVPDVSFFSRIIGEAFTIAVVGYAINISLGKTFALKHGYKVDNNQELVAVGISNAVGGFFQCYPVTSSLSRSLVQESTGGKTQVAGAVSAVIVLITVLKVGSLFGDLPKAVLSAIVFANLKGMFKQYGDIPALWKNNKVDLLVWVVTFLCTLLLNLDLGLAASIAFALLTVIFRTQLTKYSVLGWVPGTELYVETDSYEKAKEIPGITIFRSSSTLYYANAELYKEALQEKSGINISKLIMLRRKQATKEKHMEKNEKKREEKERKKQNGGVSVPANSDFIIQSHVANTHLSADEHVYCDDAHSFGSESLRTRTHSIILDFSTVSFIDTVTLKTLKNIFQDFAEVDVTVCISGCQVLVVQQLEQGGFFSASVPKTHLFPTIHDAVLYCLKHAGRTLPYYQCSLEILCDTRM